MRLVSSSEGGVPIQGPNYTGLRASRPVTDSTASDIRESVTQILELNPGARRKMGGFALNIIYPYEVAAAYNNSPVHSDISIPEIEIELARIVTPLPEETQSAQVLGMSQRHRRLINFDLDYPQLHIDRAHITDSLDTLLQVEHEWQKLEPHVSAFEGFLKLLMANGVELPKEISFQGVRTGRLD